MSGFASAATACRAVSRYFGTLPQHDREESRTLWRARMEQLWRLSLRDATEQRPGAVRASVAIAQRVAQMDGLDAPTRLEIRDPDALEFEQVVAALAAANGVTLALEADPFADELEAEIVDE